MISRFVSPSYILKYAYSSVIQVRYRWNTNDLAIWDNRCTFHTATNDYEEHRQGNRIVSVGERPYFDANSKSRREVLGISVP